MLQKTWLSGNFPFVWLMKLKVMDWVATGIVEVLPQKLAGGLPSVAGLIVMLAVAEVTWPKLLLIITLNVLPTSLAWMGGV
jgi:hypothetical protein